MLNSSDRLQYLDVLRGVAAYVVVAGHFFAEGWVKSLPVINLMTDTKLSVSIFFILSGVVLTNPNGSQKLGTFWLATQVAARLIRLAIPVFFVSIFVWFLTYFSLFFSEPLPKGYEFWEVYSRDAYQEIDFMRVLYFSWIEAFFLYDSARSLIPPAWTMRPEFIGSIVVFTHTWLSQKTLYFRSPVLLLFISIILILTYGYLPLIYYFSFFLTGVALRKLMDENFGWNRSTKWTYRPVLMLIMVLGCKTFFEFFKIDGLHLDFVFGGLIVFYLMQAKRLHHIICWKPLLWLAKISFPLYLLHVPLIASFGLSILNYLGKIGLSPEVGQFVTFGALSIGLFLLAQLFYPTELLAIHLSRKVRHLSKYKR